MVHPDMLLWGQMKSIHGTIAPATTCDHLRPLGTLWAVAPSTGQSRRGRNQLSKLEEREKSCRMS